MAATGGVGTSDAWDLAMVLVPLACAAAYAAIGGALFAVRWARGEPPSDREAETRRGGILTRRPLHGFFAWLMDPWLQLLRRAGVSPDAVTGSSVLFGIGAGASVAAGRFALAGWLYALAGACDFLDGRLARVSGRQTAHGAALDSVTDRYCELAVLTGLAWWYRSGWMLPVVLAALSGSLIVPYVRARAEGLGITQADVGFVQRPERVVLLAAAMILSPVVEALEPTAAGPTHGLVAGVLVLLAITTHATALHRLSHLCRALDRPRVVAPGPAAGPAARAMPRGMTHAERRAAARKAPRARWVLARGARRA